MGVSRLHEKVACKKANHELKECKTVVDLSVELARARVKDVVNKLTNKTRFSAVFILQNQPTL